MSSSTYKVYALFFIVLSGVYFAYSVFRLPSSVPRVSCACLPAPVVLVVVISCHSACRLALSFGFPCLPRGLGKLRFLLRLSCLSLVVVLCSPDSFFTLWVCFFFFSLASVASFLCLSSLLFFPSALLRFLFFYMCLLRSVVSSLYSPLPFIRCGCSPLRQFPVSLLACSVLLLCSPLVVFLAFLMVSSSFRSFCLPFVCLYLRLSLCWFALVPPFCVFSLTVRFFLAH